MKINKVFFSIVMILKEKALCSKKSILLGWFMFFSVFSVLSQDFQVSGTVSDANGISMPGVTVVVRGTTRGVSSDENGKFSISVPNDASVLQFSFIGYQTYEVTVGSLRVIDVVLDESSQQIDELIITGFGSFRASHYNGSASVIKTDNLQGIPNQSVASMIQANAPGVSVATTSSQPGAYSTLRIRGYGSFNASNSPLFVIDGVPVMSGDINQTGRTGTNGGGTDIMATLNPNDISNITVIKDAAAASLWGSRAANGVILITTKQGDKSRTRVSFSSDIGGSDFAYNFRPMMGGEERRQFIYDAYVRHGMYFRDTPLSEQDAIAFANEEMQKDANLANPRWSVEPWSGWTDWRKEAFRKGSHNNQEISLSGGSERMTYYTSFSRSNSKGLQKDMELNRLTGRMNVAYDANNWLRLGANMMFSDMTQSLGYEYNWYYTPTYVAFVKGVPSDPVYNEDGTYNTIFIDPSVRSIAAYYDLGKNEQRVTRTFNTVFAEVRALPTLSFKTTFSYDFTNSRGDQWDHPIYHDEPANNGIAEKSYQEYRQMVWSTNANYVNTLGENHNVDALIAFEIMDFYDNFLDARQYNFLNFEQTEIGLGALPNRIRGHYQQDRMTSYISRVNYNWKHRYYLGGSFRRDGTSRLHENSRWGNFWSVSAGWRFSSEDFMSAAGFLSNGKLRASYGVNGTRPSGRYAYMSLTSLTNTYDGEVALMETNIANNKMLWESNHSLNLGIDLTVFNRFDISFEFYNRITKDLLMDLPISMTTGFSSFTTNIGSMRNRGIEITVNTNNIRTEDFSWNTQFNISHNRNVILELDGTDSDMPHPLSSSYLLRKGLPYYMFYMIEYSHINPENGRPMFFMNDELEDGTINRELTDNQSNATRIPYKSPFPKAVMGLTNNFRWRFIDLGFTFSSTLGGYSYDRAADKTQTSGASDALVNQIPTYYRDSWKQPGDNANYEAWIPGTISASGTRATSPMNSYRMIANHNTRRVHSTDHVRLKNFTAGVSLPRQWANAINVDLIRIYFTGQNLWTLAAHDDYDPEVPANGWMWYNTPPLKSYSIGININF